MCKIFLDNYGCWYPMFQSVVDWEAVESSGTCFLQAGCTMLYSRFCDFTTVSDIELMCCSHDVQMNNFAKRAYIPKMTCYKIYLQRYASSSFENIDVHGDNNEK